MNYKNKFSLIDAIPSETVKMKLAIYLKSNVSNVYEYDWQNISHELLVEFFRNASGSCEEFASVLYDFLANRIFSYSELAKLSIKLIECEIVEVADAFIEFEQSLTSHNT